MTDQERAIFSKAHEDYDAAFVQLLDLFIDDLYRVALGATFYNESAAWQLTLETVQTAYKYFHQYQPHQGSFRLYLLGLLTSDLHSREDRVPSTQDRVPSKLKRHWTPQHLALWHAIQKLPAHEWLVVELWLGEQLSVSEIALVLHQPLSKIQHTQTQASHQLQKASTAFMEQATHLYTQRNQFATLSRAQRIRMARLVIDKKRLAPTFIHTTWAQRIFSPGIMGGVAVIGLLSAVILVAVVYREPIEQALKPAKANPNQIAQFVSDLVTNVRPSFGGKTGKLPEVEVVRKSLTETKEYLYGSNYVANRTNDADPVSVTPVFTLNVKPEEYVAVQSAYTYTVPDALTEDQLQYAALRHFSSLPLNQFTYVNGTYYIEDKPNEFRPVFIAFNNNGTIDYQLRQAAICQLAGITDQIADPQAQSNGYDFLAAHKLLEVSDDVVGMDRVSPEGRTVTKDAFCKNGDTTSVQDRELVYYPPHTVLHYAEDANSLLPMRFRGMAIQMHGSQVTNLRVDPLFLLQQYVTRKPDAVTLKPLTQAQNELAAYVYPSDAERADKDRNAVVFPQWNRSHGDARIQQQIIDAVDLEYVYDELNHVIEPYYVFSGPGTGVDGKVNATRWYVAASTEAKELRAPYRE